MINFKSTKTPTQTFVKQMIIIIDVYTCLMLIDERNKKYFVFTSNYTDFVLRILTRKHFARVPRAA